MLRRAAAIVVLLVAAPSTAGAAVPTAPGAGGSPQAIRQLADQLTTTALATIDQSGRLWDPIGRNLIDYYGPAGFGYAGLRAAVRSGDGLLLERALRAVMVSVEHRHATPFDQLLVAKAYAFAQQRLAGNRVWQAVVPRVAAYLDDPPFTSTEQRPSDSWLDIRRYNNWKLVELAARAVAQSAGRFPTTAARSARLHAIGRMASRAKARAARTRWVVGRVRALSDPPSNPIAYSAFSAAMLADARRFAPTLVPAALARRGRDLSRYLLAITAPNGTVAWAGRSSQLSWTLAATMVAGANLRTPAGRGLANGAWQRLTAAHGVRPDGSLAIAPVLHASNDTAGIDRYANTVIYGGLTAALLNDAADALDGQPALTGAPPAASHAGTIDDRGGSGATAQRAGDVWWAATMRPSHLDSRYETGLQQIQIRRPNNSWRSVLPGRPKVLRSSSYWPAPSRCTWRPRTATTLRCGRASLRVDVDHAARRVRLRLRVRPGQQVAGRLDLPAPRRSSSRVLAWATGSLRSSAPLRLRVDPTPRSSATDTHLRTVRYRSRADRHGRLTLTIG